MSKDNEVTIIPQNDFKKDMSLTGDDINRVIAHLDIVKEAVAKVLKEGIDADYAVIPGTKKKSLLKPGAEKLMKLFGLGVKYVQGEKEFDRYENFAMYSYTAIVYHLRSGTEIATCEGTANSGEKKNKEKASYIEGVYAGQETVQVCDIVNSLKKMAQKRAMVGAVILATGASDYFSQDLEDGNHGPEKKKAKRTDASMFATKGESKNHADYVVRVAKYKGSKLKDIDMKELTSYVNSVANNNPKIDGPLKEFLDTAREYIRMAA